MVKLISYPFRLTSVGSVQTTEDGEDYYAEELAVLVQTVPGERILVPDYGMSDPTFDSFSKAELVEKISMFGPPVSISTITSEFLSGERVSVNIDYSPLDVETGGADEFDFLSGVESASDFDYAQTGNFIVDADLGFYDDTEGS